MEFNISDALSNIYQTSKSSKDGSYLLDSKHHGISIYSFDTVKSLMCKEYRDGKCMRSCDAYFQNKQRKDYLIIEFKNSSHLNFKGYFKEFYEKAFDTHMCFLQALFGKKCRTFWRILHLHFGECCRGSVSLFRLTRYQCRRSQLL